jgi:hypothetical protein
MNTELKIYKSDKDNLFYWEILVNGNTLAICQKGYMSRVECRTNLKILENTIAYLNRLESSTEGEE